MKCLVVIFCVFAIHANFCHSQANRQIIGGTSTTIASFPYLAGVFNPSWPSEPMFFICGGAIINFRSVLTAAHCIVYAAQDIQVNVGASRQNGQDGTFFRVSNVYIHPSYQGVKTAIIADIAVIRTIFPFSFGVRVRPISLGTATINANERVTISGWGSTTDNGPTSVQLQTLDMMTVSNNQCAAMHSNTQVRGWITSEKICTIGNPNTGICAGDSGSPLVLRNSVIGVASYTVRPCAAHPSVFIRVSNHLEWIRQNL